MLSPLRGLVARLAYTVTDARFERYVVGDVVYDGNRVPGLAPVHFDVTLSYRSSAGWYVGIDHRRRSRTPVDDGNTAYSPGHHVTDVRLGVEGLRIGEFEASPFGVTNLFDAEYDAAFTVNAFGGRYLTLPGRAFYLGARVVFGESRATQATGGAGRQTSARPPGDQIAAGGHSRCGTGRPRALPADEPGAAAAAARTGRRRPSLLDRLPPLPGRIAPTLVPCRTAGFPDRAGRPPCAGREPVQRFRDLSPDLVHPLADQRTTSVACPRRRGRGRPPPRCPSSRGAGRGRRRRRARRRESVQSARSV